MSPENSITASQVELFERLARAYADGDANAGLELIATVDEDSIPHLPHVIRATLMDAIMSGRKQSLDERQSALLRSALYATTDDAYLSTRGQFYLEAGEQMAAETLLEWRVVLAARKQRGSDAHIRAMLDLAEVYETGAKNSEAKELRAGAATVCEQRPVSTASGKMMTLIAQRCFDASDLKQSESVARRAQKILEQQSPPRDEKANAAIVDCLRLLHGIAQKRCDYDEAQSLAKRIQVMLGAKDEIDEIGRMLNTYVRLPASFDLTTRPDGITLTTDDFPRIVQECSGLDLQKYFVDAFSQHAALTQAERAKIAADLFHVLRTVTIFKSDPTGAKMTRSEVTPVDLPAAMSQGFVQKVTFDKMITFRLVPNLPDEATFVSVSGITFSVGGKLVAMSELSLRAEGNECVVTPLLGEFGTVKQAATSKLEALKNTGKDFLVGFFLKTKTFSTSLPIVLSDFRRYLADAVNLKRSLHYKEKDLLSFFERCSRIEVEDPLTRALLVCGTRVAKNEDSIIIERSSDSNCDLSGVQLKIAPTVNFKMTRTTKELAIPEMKGVDVRVAFDAPAELKVIGLDLRKSLPTCIENLTLSAVNEKEVRRLVVGTGVSRWIGIDLDKRMKPACDAEGNWMVFGVTSNPISGASQSFFLRLDKKNDLKMTTREIAALVNQTAMEGFDPADPFTWQWGAVAIGAQTLLTAGAVLRGTIGDEETDKIAEEVQEIAKYLRNLFS